MKKDITTLRLDLVPVHTGPDGESKPLQFMDLTQEIPPVRFLFRRKGHSMVAASNICTIKGKMKEGKSAAGLALMAAALGGRFLGIEADRGDVTVLWIDTEQDAATLRQKGLAVLKMAGLDASTMPDRLKVLPLRGWGSPAEKLDATLRAVEDICPDLVFLDGVVDLCDDFNDVEKSRETVLKLEAQANRFGAAIVGVIHTNKNDSNARGHLGGELEHKSGEVYEVERDGFVATVKQAFTRFTPGASFSFRFADDFLLEETFDITGEGDMAAALRSAFEPLFRNGETMVLDDTIEYTYTDLWKSFKDFHGSGMSTAKTKISAAVKSGVLEKTVRPVRYRIRTATRDFGRADDEDDRL